jgi:signal transduction histidine kinase
VIAIGRYMLASLLLFALWFDASPAFNPFGTPFAVNSAYVIFALIILVVTWSNWWLDARLAGPAHAVDILVFTMLVFSTEGFDSPYFTFFVFVLLSAAIRWGWRATALTAILLMTLYLLAGMVVSEQSTEIMLHDFIDRTGHLIILSLILIWFGINQWRSGIHARETTTFADPSLDESPIETSLRAAMDRLDAGTGILVWNGQDRGPAEAFVARKGVLSVMSISGRTLQNAGATPFLYQLAKDRSLSRDEQRNLRPAPAREQLQPKAVKALELSEGVAIPIRTGAGGGELFLEAIPNLSTDHIDLASEIASDVAGHIERHAYFRAVEESAEARSRLALARDLHDSVVQFLAGAAFRLEALKRDLVSGRDLEPELNHLKQLMLQEQGELRSFIAALRSAPQVGLDELAKDLRSLSERLAQQWDVFCEFTSQTTEMMIPTRVQLDAQHLLREAVANAVRHAGAKSVTIRLRSEPEQLRLDFINDGSRYPKSPLTGEMPRSLSERVKLAGGDFELSRGMGVTKISVTLPIGRLQ